MPIPQNITREHILKAIKRVVKEGVPPRRKERNWAVLFEDKRYPCKLLISWANIYANGDELDSSLFTTDHAQAYLQQKGFNIIPI